MDNTLSELLGYLDSEDETISEGEEELKGLVNDNLSWDICSDLGFEDIDFILSDESEPLPEGLLEAPEEYSEGTFGGNWKEFMGLW